MQFPFSIPFVYHPAPREPSLATLARQQLEQQAERYAQREHAAAPRSTVGELAHALDRTRQKYIASSLQLSQQIKALTEELRQTEAALAATDAALTALCDDPALTPPEQALAMAPQNDALEEAMDVYTSIPAEDWLHSRAAVGAYAGFEL